MVLICLYEPGTGMLTKREVSAMQIPGKKRSLVIKIIAQVIGRLKNYLLRSNLYHQKTRGCWGRIEGCCSHSFFAFMDLCEVVYIIWTLKPVNDWTQAHEMVFFKISRCLRLVSVFEAILVAELFMTWILKDQFSNLAPWNMPNLSLFTAWLWLCSFWWISTKDVKEFELVLVAQTFAEGLNVNDILRWCWTEVNLHEFSSLGYH